MRWRDKPPFGTPLDLRHKLARSVIGAWTFNEAQGTKFQNAANPGFYDLSIVSSAGTWTSTTAGVLYRTTGGHLSAGVIGDVNGLSQLTIFIKGTWSVYFSSGRSGGSSLLNILGDNTGGLKASIGGNYGSATTGILGDCTLAMVFDGTQATNATRLKVYVNGRPITLSFTGTIPSTIPTDVTGAWRIGAQSGFSPDYDSLRVVDLLMSTAATDDDVYALHAMPWDLYRPSPGWSDAEYSSYYSGGPVVAPQFRRTMFARSGSRGVA